MSRPKTDVQIIESLAGTGALVDSENAVIKGVKLIGLESKNGRSYPAGVLRDAVSHYEGLRVNADHPKQPGDPRSMRDRIGVIQGARFVEGRGIFGDFKYNPKHQLADQFVWEAQQNPSALGFSHNATLKLKPGVGGDGKRVVEAIVGVRSLDLVADPATTNGFFESQDSDSFEDDDMDLKALTLEQLKSARPDLIESVTEAIQAESQETQELESLRSKVKALEAAEAKRKLESEIAAEIESAGLTKEQCSAVFMESLNSAQDQAARKALIDDRKSLVGATEGKAKKTESTKPKTTNVTEGQADADSWRRRILSRSR